MGNSDMSDADKPEDRDSTILDPQDDGAPTDGPGEPAIEESGDPDVGSGTDLQHDAQAAFADDRASGPEPAADNGVQQDYEPVAAAAAPAPIWSDAGDAPGDPDPADETRASEPNEVVEIVKTVFYALLIALVLRVLLFQPFTIPSASMEPNLYEGDYIIVSKWSYGYSRHSIPFSPPIFDGRVFREISDGFEDVVLRRRL